MLHTKIQALVEVGMFNPYLAQKTFVKSKINYKIFDPEAPLFFTTATKEFLQNLDDISYLRLYLNSDNYFNREEWDIFKQTIMADYACYQRIIYIATVKIERLPIDLLIPMMHSSLLTNHIPTNYIFKIVSENPEFRKEIANHPAIVDFLTNRSRAQAYIWGDLLPFPFPGDQTDTINNALNNFHI